MAHSWPGNVRELENVIQRMMVVCKGEILDLQDLPTEMRGTEGRVSDKATGLKGISQESEKKGGYRCTLSGGRKCHQGS